MKRLRAPGFEVRLALLTLGLWLLPMGVIASVLWQQQAPLWAWAVWWGLPLGIGVALLVALRRQLVFPLRTVATLLEALRQGDYAFRGARAQRGDVLGDVVLEINQLAHTLRDNRLKTEETLALLRRTLDSIDIAILTFDAQAGLRMLNPAGERLLGRPARELLGRSASSLDMGTLLEGAATRSLELHLPGGSGRFELRRAAFREAGAPMALVVLTDLSRALREEERLAFRRLIRVLGHELNNSLAPIKSMAATLATLLGRDPLPADWRDDARQVLDVIADRSDALARFLAAYSQLARLPPPHLRPCRLDRLLEQVARMEPRLPVNVLLHPELPAEFTLQADADQLGQALINLVKNATEATLAAHPHALQQGMQVQVQVHCETGWLSLNIIDDGVGLAPTENLFVPFFTTKAGGSGVGLVLARQVVEAHQGSLSLSNRGDAPGCRVSVRLPLG